MFGPYSKWQSLTVCPSGFTVAFKLAEDCPTDDAGSVTTTGASVNVVND